MKNAGGEIVPQRWPLPDGKRAYHQLSEVEADHILHFNSFPERSRGEKGVKKGQVIRR
jgi:hypothetical protein